jgi:glycosyltransferase involved in cell wall biosynthesis
MKLLIVSVTPSPYQRDVFRVLATKQSVQVQVAYYEHAADDSPWELAGMEPWEHTLPGKVIGSGRVRCHCNHPLPDVPAFDRVIINAPLTALTTQALFRKLSKKGSPLWYFWGETLINRRGLRGYLQKSLASPLARATAIVAIGRKAADDYKRRFPGVPIHNIPYACDLNGFQKAARERQAHPACRFLFVGQMIPRKGVDVLLKAFSRLVVEGYFVELHLAGREGELPRWLSELKQGVRERVTYHGFLQPEALPSVFRDADVFVLPSRHDGWGVVVNQAMGAGLPVITSTAAGAGNDLVENGVEGIHVPPDEVESLFMAMERLVVDSDLRQHLASAATKKSLSLTPEAAARKWIEVLFGEGNQSESLQDPATCE